MEKVYKKLVRGIRDYFSKTLANSVVIGVSGGIDSAVVAKLAVDSLGNEKVHALIMPEIGLTNKQNTDDAIEFCRNLNIKFIVIEINDFLKAFKKIRWKQNELAIQNNKARIRANILYNYANSNNCLVLGTSNKTELVLGYITKYGDSAVDLEVIGSLYKTEVIKLAEFLKIPRRIIGKTPSAELLAGQTDEADLGASYKKLDAILKLVEKGKSKKEIAKEFDLDLVESILTRIKVNTHKTKPVPVLK